MGLIARSIPFFFLLIAVEIFAAKRLGRRVYRLNDSISDLSCGVVQQLLGVLVGVVAAAGYGALYRRGVGLAIDPASPLAWIALFVGVDFFYYWFHRLSHEVNFLWAAHVVHHQSDEYNLTVALRQAAFQSSFSWLFYLPLALIGFPPAMTATMTALNTIYQFWIHTRLIGRLGPLEWIINTPSHHRVHHGRNPKYIDKNHGGTLIVWDRLFGTFQVEEEEPIYGITMPVRSWNPVWVNFQEWGDQLGFARRALARGEVRDAIRIFFEKPGRQYARPSQELSDPVFDPHVARGAQLAAVAMFVPATLAAVAYLHAARTAPAALLAAIAGAVLLVLVNVGALLEGRRWAFPRLRGAPRESPQSAHG